MKESFQRIVQWAKKHPLLAALIVGAVILLGYLAYRRAQSGGGEEASLQVGPAEQEEGTGGAAAEETIPVPPVPGIEATPLTFPSFEGITFSGGGGGNYKMPSLSAPAQPLTVSQELVPPSEDLSTNEESFYTGGLVSTPITQALAAGVPATLLGIPDITSVTQAQMQAGLQKALASRPLVSTPTTQALMAGVPSTIVQTLPTSQKKTAKPTSAIVSAMTAGVPSTVAQTGGGKNAAPTPVKPKPKPKKSQASTIAGSAKPTLTSTPKTQALKQGVPSTVLNYMPKKK